MSETSALALLAESQRQSPSGNPGGISGRGAMAARSSRGTAPSVSLPSAIGRYGVIKLLGEGAMGRVYLAKDPELSREVAIKVLRLESAGNAKDAYIARFRNEARGAARLLHPNVVAVYDAGVDAQLGPYLVYEYVSGRTLRARLHEGRLQPEELLALARGVGDALDAIHQAGIVHRDIKPDNILLSPTGVVKITDLGIARVPDASLTRDGQFLGTPAYAAPEAITKGEYSPKSDVFSFAAVLYEAFCGIRPFPGDDAVAVSYAVANDTPLAPSRYVLALPSSVDDVFARGLAKKTIDRVASAGEFSALLHGAFRRPVPNGATATTTATVTAIRRPQHPTAVAPTSSSRALGRTFLIALVVIAIVWAIAKRRSSSDETDSSATSSSAHPLVHEAASGHSTNTQNVIRNGSSQSVVTRTSTSNNPVRNRLRSTVRHTER